MFKKLKSFPQPCQCIRNISGEFCDHKRGFTLKRNKIKRASSSFLDIIQFAKYSNYGPKLSSFGAVSKNKQKKKRASSFLFFKKAGR